MRKGDWKYVYAEQRAPGTMQVWAEPFTKLRLSRSSLFQDPFERADITSNTYWDWQINTSDRSMARWTKSSRSCDVQRLPRRVVPTELRADDDREQTIDDMKDAMKRKSSAAGRCSKGAWDGLNLR